MSEDAPKAGVELPALAAGKVADVTLRLPLSAMKLIGTDSQAKVFTQLVVAVDLNDTVAESDETNNVAVLDRTALKIAAR